MSFNCTAKDEVISSRLFIEASAGTGKTFVIEHYVVRAVLGAAEQKIEVDPQQFALITFTKAVANELRLRVLKALKNARAYFLEENFTDEVPEYFSHFSNKKQAVRALSLFIDRFNRATITTIHGFCEQLLKIWQDESGEEEGEWELQEKKWLQEFLQEEKRISVYEWNILAKNDSYDEDYFLDRVIALMDDPLIFSTPSREECLGVLEKSIHQAKETFGIALEKTADLLKSYAKQFRGNCTKGGELHPEKKEFFEQFEKLLGSFTESNLNALLKIRIDFSSLFETPLKGSIPLADEQYAYFQTLIGKIWPCIASLRDPEAIRRRIAAEAAKRFFSYSLEKKKKTFETLLRRALSLTQNEKFCKEIRDYFSWVIVDEFQDTDRTQLSIFSKLFLHDGWKGNILFVGDPKQAIYGFRKADVYSYMHAKDLLQSSVRTLFVNYRASSDMVCALNALFADPLHRQIFYLPKEQRYLSITPSSSAGRVEPLKIGQKGALHFVVAKSGIGRKRNWPHEEIEKQFFSWMHDELIFLEESGVPFKHQAILVRDRYQAKRVEEFLSLRNIPTCCWRLDLVTESDIYPWLKKAFSLLLQPNDKKKLLSLLFSMDGEEEVCQQIAKENDFTTFALAVKEWEKVRDVYLKCGIGGLSRALFNCRYNGQNYLYEYLGVREKSLTLDLEQILEALFLLEDRVPQDIGGLLHALTHIEEYFVEQREQLLRRVDPDDMGVPILTIHRSKGLEFEVVYSLGSSSRTPEGESNLEEIDAEKLRQIYVALTRAKRRVYLPLFLEMDEKKVPKGRASPVELILSCLQTNDESRDLSSDSLYKNMLPSLQREKVFSLVKNFEGVITHTEIEEKSEKKSYVKKVEEISLVESKTLFGAWRKMSSFSRQKKRNELLFHESKSGGGALFGLQFHEAIESLLFAEKNIRQSLEEIEALYGKSELACLLYQALHVPLSSLGTALEGIVRKNMRAEVPFLFEENGSYVSGTIDLMFLQDEKIYLLDWKTQQVDKPLQEYILEQQYDLQYSIYKRAVVEAYPNVAWGGFYFVFVRNLVAGKEGVYFYE